MMKESSIDVKELVYASMLAALALLIPITFGGYLRVMIPPFSATLASHVPMFLSMLISPFAAVFVGFGSALGFFIVLDAVIGARAAVHIFVGAAGALLVRRGHSLAWAALLVLPIHALGEALVVIPFGFSLYDAGIVVGVGTALHHVVDAVIAIAIYRALKTASFNLRGEVGTG